jgi:hypothetical protein
MSCTILIAAQDRLATADEVLSDLESSDSARKCRALKSAIALQQAGESIPRVLMTVIRFCINAEDKEVKKLMLLFWEVVPKYAADGKLLPEMILVVNALRNDLGSPNEFVRGCMLRFLAKMTVAEIVEPLIPAIKACLEHRHSYVRKNAALAIAAISARFGSAMLPDGPDLMVALLASEADHSARRNASLSSEPGTIGGRAAVTTAARPHSLDAQPGGARESHQLPHRARTRLRHFWRRFCASRPRAVPQSLQEGPSAEVSLCAVSFRALRLVLASGA